MKNKVQCTVLWVFILFLFISSQLNAQQSDAYNEYKQSYDSQISDLLCRQYQEAKGWFEDAYREYPTVPRGVLEAVAFQYTRFSPNQMMDTLERNPSQKPRVYSIMGVTLHGKGVFRENARLIASITPYSLEDILWRPGVAVSAYACAFAQLQQKYRCLGDSLEQYKPIFIDLCELPLPGVGEDAFAMNSFLYMIYYFLGREEYIPCGGPGRQVDYERLFGDEYYRLRADKADVSRPRNPRSPSTIPDYPNAVFVPAASCNYTTGRNGTVVSSVTVHYTQGTYAGSIAWFQNCSASASAHYVIRSVDGQVTQMVSEADKAWHVGVANSYTIGIEHEAYGNIYSYFTMNMYQSSANLVKDICSRRSNINPHRIFYRDTLDDGTVLNYGVHSLGGATACTQIRGHQHYPSQTHTDPGQYWNWNLYYKLINDNPPVTIATSDTGTFTDSGGALGDYGDDERRLFRIHVPGADSIALTFQSFHLEPDYDFMWIYDGGSEFSPLIGRWNTQSPGRVVAFGEQMLVEFRSDCATHAAGWVAQWQACSGGQNQSDDGNEGDEEEEEEDEENVNDWEVDENEPLSDNAAPQTAINLNAAQWITGDFSAVFTDTDDSGLKWRFYQIMESDGVVWSARPEQGFLCDNFDNQLNTTVWLNNSSVPWTVQNGALRQNDATSDYAGISAHHNGMSHVAFLYDFYLNFSEGDKCSFFFNCNNPPSLTSLFSGYEVCFDRANHTVSVYRLILGTKRLLKRNAQVYFQVGTSYLCRIVFDSSTGEIIVLRHANRIVRAVDDALATVSNSYVGFVTCRAAVSVDNIRVYGSRASSVPVSVGASDTCNLQLQAVNGLSRAKLKSIVMDSAYKFSPLVEKSLKVDYTAPPKVTGLSLTVDTLFLPDGSRNYWVSANWNPSTDVQSGVLHYYYQGFSGLKIQWNPSWPDNGVSNTCQHCVLIPSNTLIQFSVVAENGAGLRSSVTTQMVSKSTTPDKENLSKKIFFDVTLVSGKRLMISLSQDDLELSTGKVNYSLYDMSGRKLKTGFFFSEGTVDVSDIAKGIYLLRIMRDGTFLQTEKIILPY